MRCLLLSGHGIRMNVENAKLKIQDGRNSLDSEPVSYILRPKVLNYDNIVIYGHNGHITFEAMRWLVKQNIQLTLLNWNGKLLTNIMPPESKQTKLKFKQYEAYGSPLRVEIAKKLIEAKLERSKTILDWLRQRYPETDNDLSKYQSRLSFCKTIEEIMNVEGLCAEKYWGEVARVFDKNMDFISRRRGKMSRPMGAVDPINTLFNYGYAILESQCRKWINVVGLDTHVGFLHEAQTGKESLVYDLQEPFRWLVDIFVITAIEKRIFEKSDFIRTENYNLRLRPSGTRKLLKEMEFHFRKPVEYLGSNIHWDYLIFLKTRELAHYLIGKKQSISFGEPKVNLVRDDSSNIREKILKMTNKESKKLGIGKSQLWYLKEKAKSDKSFKIYTKVRQKLV